MWCHRCPGGLHPKEEARMLQWETNLRPQSLQKCRNPGWNLPEQEPEQHGSVRARLEPGVTRGRRVCYR